MYIKVRSSSSSSKFTTFQVRYPTLEKALQIHQCHATRTCERARVRTVGQIRWCAAKITCHLASPVGEFFTLKIGEARLGRETYDRVFALSNPRDLHLTCYGVGLEPSSGKAHCRGGSGCLAMARGGSLPPKLHHTFSLWARRVFLRLKKLLYLDKKQKSRDPLLELALSSGPWPLPHRLRLAEGAETNVHMWMSMGGISCG